MLPWVVGITGKRRAGKDTLASTMVSRGGYVRMAFADELKRDVAEFLGVSAEELERRKEDFRAAMQEYGSRRRREDGDDYWIFRLEDAWVNKMNKSYNPIIIPDVRYHNEAAWVRCRGGVVVRVIRTPEPTGMLHEPEAPTSAEIDQHTSETDMDRILVDYVVSAASGDLASIRRQGIALLEELMGVTA